MVLDKTILTMPEENENNMDEENKTGFAGFLKSRNGKIVLGVVIGLFLCVCCISVVAAAISIIVIQPTQFG